MQRLTDLFSFKTSTDQDERDRLYLTPVAVKLVRGSVDNEKLLLKDRPCQVLFAKSEVCRMENGADGEKAALLLDFGRELHGFLRLTVSDVKSPNYRVNMTIRFGESAMEALSPWGGRTPPTTTPCATACTTSAS